MMASCGAAAVPAPRPAAATARYCCVSCAAYAVLLCALYMCCRAAAAVHVCCAPCCCARVHCAAVLLCCVLHVQCSPSSTVYSRCIVLRLTLTFGNARTPKRYLGSLFWFICSVRACTDAIHIYWRASCRRQEDTAWPWQAPSNFEQCAGIHV